MVFQNYDLTYTFSRGPNCISTCSLRAKAKLSLDLRYILDSLFGKRDQEIGGESRVRNQFLKEMDGVVDKGKNLPLYVIGATNKPWSLDWPFLRRFQKRINVTLPNLDARTEMLEIYTSSLKLSKYFKLSDLANYFNGYSGSDIRDFCQSVQLTIVSKLFEHGNPGPESTPDEITTNDFIEMLKKRKKARQEGNWTLSDKIRDSLKSVYNFNPFSVFRLAKRVIAV